MFDGDNVMPGANIPTRYRPIIRLFISSTFSDLKQERAALQERVFPTLEQLCLKEGFQFQAIDLRWGVSTEAGLDHRTMRICLEELRRSQEISPEPNFLILLGNRYGWRPLPEEISADEFRSLERAARQMQPANAGSLPVEVLARWYRLDANALLPVYVLQPRTGPQNGDHAGADYTRTETWREVEEVLWQIINSAFPPAAFQGRFALPRSADQLLPTVVRFQASATEQEIWSGALGVPRASEHVLAFFRELDLPQSIARAEQLKDYFDFVSGEIDPLSAAAQQELKAEIKRRLVGHAVDLPSARLLPETDQDGKEILLVSTDHLDELCRQVERRLTDLIERQVKQYWRETESPDTNDQQAKVKRRADRELEIERDEHFRFGCERGPRDLFVGRDDQLQKIAIYVNDNSPWPLVIHGASGCGKTGLLARAVQEFVGEQEPVVRFIGVTPASSDLRSLLSSLCQELRQRNPITGPLSTNVSELIEEFQSHLAAATAQRPVTLFLDGLDQLAGADDGPQLLWVPIGPLPRYVKLIVSCLSGRDVNDPAGEPYRVLQGRGLPTGNLLELSPLNRVDAQALLFDRWLRSAGRTVNDTQRRLVEQRLDQEACRQPLYLKLLFEEVKLWRSYDADRRLNEPSVAGAFVSALLQQLFDRLSLEVHHGQLLVARALGYIAAARRGLSETEILEVLFADSDYKQQLEETSRRNRHQLPILPPRIPISLWSRLRSDLAPYLAERSAPGGNVLTFYHRQVQEEVQRRFASNGDRELLHGRLGRYFERRLALSPAPMHDTPPGQSWWSGLRDAAVRVVRWYNRLAGRERLATATAGVELRIADELPWQFQAAADWESLARILANLGLLHCAWQNNQDEVAAYWTTVENQLGPRAVAAYRPQCEVVGAGYQQVWSVPPLLHRLGYNAEAAEIQSAVSSATARHGSSEQIAAALHGQALLLRTQGDSAGAMALLRKVQAIYERLNRQQGLVLTGAIDAMGTLGGFLRDEGKIGEALQVHQEQLRLAIAFGDMRRESVSLSQMVADLLAGGNIDRAVPLLEQGLALCQRCGNLEGFQILLQNKAAIHIDRGELDQALSTVAQKRDIAVRLGDRTGVANCCGLTALVAQHRGDLQTALVHLAEMEAIARTTHDRSTLAVSLKQQAQVQLICGNFDAALVQLAEARSICQTSHEFQALEDILRQTAHAAENMGQLELAASCYEQLTGLAKQLQHPRLQALSLYHRARLLLPQRRYEVALAVLREAEVVCVEHQLRLELSEIKQAMGMACEGAGDIDNALANYEEAARQCEQSGNYFGLVTSLGYTATLLQHCGAPPATIESFAQRCWMLVRRHGLSDLVPYLESTFPGYRP